MCRIQENYDLEWLRRTMIVLSILYFLYVILLLTDRTILYVVIKSVMLVVWFYFFYKALFLKNIRLEHSFKNGWDLPSNDEEEDDDDEEQRGALFKRYAEEVNTWFEREKPYLNDDLRLTDLQRVFLSVVPIFRNCLIRNWECHSPIM